MEHTTGAKSKTKVQKQNGTCSDERERERDLTPFCLGLSSSGGLPPHLQRPEMPGTKT